MRPPLGVVKQVPEVPKMSSRQRWTMVLVCTAAFMLLLDIAIVSVALPSIQRDLRGRGKRHTVRYLLGQMDAVTAIVLSGGALGRIGEACKVARALQPSAVVIEDVDLIGEERLPRMGPVIGHHPRLLAADLDRLAGAGGRGWADHLGGERGFHGRAGAPACGRGAGKGDLQGEPPGGVAAEAADHGLGRSRGGLTTKVHLACEQGQKPLSIVITAGQRGDRPQFQAVLEAIAVPRTGPGRAGIHPDRVLADKAYGSRANRCYLRRRGIACIIPEKADQVRHRKNKGRAGGRPPAFDAELYRSATPSNAALTGSSATGPWPPVRQAGRPLRGHRPHRRDQRVAPP